MANNMKTMQNCCCEPEFEDCSELVDWLETVEIEADILPGATYPNACCSDIEPIIATLFSTVGTNTVHRKSGPICTTRNYLWSIEIGCAAGLVSFRVNLYDLAPGPGTWNGLWESFANVIADVDFRDGGTFDVPFVSSSSGTFCRVTGTPAVRLTFHE